MKIGLIRCLRTEDMNPITTCLEVINDKINKVQSISKQMEIIGVNTCGGCPGKEAGARVAEMIERGADTIVLTTCLSEENPLSFECPHIEQMKALIIKKTGESVTIKLHLI